MSFCTKSGGTFPCTIMTIMSFEYLLIGAHVLYMLCNLVVLLYSAVIV